MPGTGAQTTAAIVSPSSGPMLKRRINRGEVSATSPKQNTGTPVKSPAPSFCAIAV